MTFTIRIPALRSLALVAVGVILGATLVAPVIAQGTGVDSVAPAAIHTRTASCHGLNFHPIDDATGYDHEVASGIYVYRKNSAGSGFFTCDPGLPNKAVVTRVRFTVLDNTDEAEVLNCALVRNGLGVTTATTYHVLAAVLNTGQGATPGIVRRSTTSIAHATIDQAKWAYFFQCQLTYDPDHPDNRHGLYGADVTYTISSTNG